jgi:hypothetical protein
MMMKYSIAVAAAVAGIFAWTAGIAGQQTAAAHSLNEGAWALQFAIAENFTLGNFAGGVISAKHQRADGRAFRYGLTVSAGHISGAGTSPDRTDTTLGLVTHFLRYPTLARDPAGDLQMFWGVGPVAAFQYRRNTVADGAHTSRLLSLGAGATVGAEWFVRPRISLSAEYQTSLMARLGAGAPEEWSVRLGQDGVRFGVSLYFP